MGRFESQECLENVSIVVVSFRVSRLLSNDQFCSWNLGSRLVFAH